MIRQKTVVLTNPNDETDQQTEQQLVQTSYKNSRPPGKPTKVPFGGQPQQLTNRKFMSSSQKTAFDAGEEIWV